MNEKILTSKFIKGDFDKSLLDINVWNKQHYDFFQTDVSIVFCYRYMDYKLESCFERLAGRINYLLLEPMGSDALGAVEIIDDIGVFDGRAAVELTAVDGGCIKPYYDEGELTSIYWLPPESELS